MYILNKQPKNISHEHSNQKLSGMVAELSGICLSSLLLIVLIKKAREAFSFSRSASGNPLNPFKESTGMIEGLLGVCFPNGILTYSCRFLSVFISGWINTKNPPKHPEKIQSSIQDGFDSFFLSLIVLIIESTNSSI